MLNSVIHILASNTNIFVDVPVTKPVKPVTTKDSPSTKTPPNTPDESRASPETVSSDNVKHDLEEAAEALTPRKDAPSSKESNQPDSSGKLPELPELLPDSDASQLGTTTITDAESKGEEEGTVEDPVTGTEDTGKNSQQADLTKESDLSLNSAPNTA